MGKKRPSLVRPNAYLDDCIIKLPLSEGSVDSDQILVHWVKLQILADDLTAQISPDIVNLTEAKARTAYKAFERQLKDWDEERAGYSDSRQSLLRMPKTLSSRFDSCKEQSLTNMLQ